MIGSFGAFLGAAFFISLCAYMLFNLAKDQKIEVNKEGVQQITNTVKHKWLQLILWGCILLGLLIIGVAVVDMSSQSCNQVLINETTTYTDSLNHSTTYNYDIVCSIEENTPAITFQRLIYNFGVPVIGFYIVLMFILRAFAKVDSMRREKRRRQGRL